VPSGRFRAIIFDIGCVLIRVDISRAMSGLAKGHSLSPQEIWSALEKAPRWPDWQEGRISPRDWHLYVNQRLGGSLTFEQFTETWNSALDPKPIQDSSFLKKLAQSHRLALLSNTDPIHVAHMESAFDFFRFFPARVYSCSVGVRKPDPLIYREALKACRVQADEAIYVDDVPAFAEAARRLGMTGISFQSPEQLQADLTSLGIDLG
jgi:HAD superfamily hydrolase (TIGR01509 family)